MKKILLSLLLASGVNNSLAMQAGGGAAQGSAAGSASAATADDSLSPVDKALFSAVRSGDLEAVRAQLAGGADVNAKDAKGRSSLMIAAQKGYVDVVQALLAAGADVNKQSSEGCTALIVAAQNGHVEVVRALLAGGADVNVPCAKGWSSLMLAAQNGHVEVVQELLAAGADVNKQSSESCTALIVATQNGHVDVVRALLAGGADVNVPCAKGWSSLMIAAYHGHVEVVQALIHAGANVDVKSFENKTAMNYASGKPEIIRLLQAHKASQADQVASAKTVPSKAAVARRKGKAAVGGGVTRAGGGATSQTSVNAKLCTAVAAEILKKDAEVQTNLESDEISSCSNSKLLAARLGSAFTRPKTTVVPTGGASATSVEQVSSEIMQPVASRPQGFALAGTQPAMLMPVAPQMPLQNLITLAVSNGTGLFGLIELLNNAAPHVNFDAHQSAALFTAIGLDVTVFAGFGYAPITGFGLADLLSQNIIAICGQVNPEIGLIPQQAALLDCINQRFALYAQSCGN